MATQIRCYACGGFFPIKEPACVECEAPRRTRNGYLETCRLNNHLYEQAEAGDNQRKAEAYLQRNGGLYTTTGAEPPEWARRRAAELIDHL